MLVFPCGCRLPSLLSQFLTQCHSTFCSGHQQEHVWRSRAAEPAMLSPTCVPCSYTRGGCGRDVSGRHPGTCRLVSLCWQLSLQWPNADVQCWACLHAGRLPPVNCIGRWCHSLLVAPRLKAHALPLGPCPGCSTLGTTTHMHMLT